MPRVLTLNITILQINTKIGSSNVHSTRLIKYTRQQKKRIFINSVCLVKGIMPITGSASRNKFRKKIIPFFVRYFLAKFTLSADLIIFQIYDNVEQEQPKLKEFDVFITKLEA